MAVDATAGGIPEHRHECLWYRSCRATLIMSSYALLEMSLSWIQNPIGVRLWRRFHRRGAEAQRKCRNDRAPRVWLPCWIFSCRRGRRSRSPRGPNWLTNNFRPLVRDRRIPIDALAIPVKIPGMAGRHEVTTL